MNDRRETELSSAPAVDWPGRFVGVAAAVIDPSGRILLVRHTYGRLSWELPGGVSEPGETFTIRRIQDAIAAAAPERVVVIPPRTWLE